MAMKDLYIDEYPASWYALMPSQRLKAGQRQPLDAFGQALVLYRTEAGKAAVQSRFCPHMGASLANGCVTGERLRCPFHHWEYDALGQCVHIPYMPAEKIPPGARLTHYPTVEHLGWIWVFNGREPSHALPDLEEAHDADYRLHWKSQRFDMHPLLLLENGCDAQHFKYVHKVDYHKYEVEICRDEPHQFGFIVHQALRTPLSGSLELKTHIHYIGASTIYGRLEFGERTVARFIAAPLPVGPKQTLFHLLVYVRRLPWYLRLVDPLFTRWFARRLFNGAIDDYAPIWRDMNTNFRQHLVAEDALQQRFRRYYRRHLAATQPK